MLHLIPVTQADESPQPYSEALARLASIRHALRLVDAFGGGPASDPCDDDPIAAPCGETSKAHARSLDIRTDRTGTHVGAKVPVAPPETDRRRRRV